MLVHMQSQKGGNNEPGCIQLTGGIGDLVARAVGSLLFVIAWNNSAINAQAISFGPSGGVARIEILHHAIHVSATFTDSEPSICVPIAIPAFPREFGTLQSITMGTSCFVYETNDGVEVYGLPESYPCEVSIRLRSLTKLFMPAFFAKQVYLPNDFYTVPRTMTINGPYDGSLDCAGSTGFSALLSGHSTQTDTLMHGQPVLVYDPCGIFPVGVQNFDSSIYQSYPGETEYVIGTLRLGRATLESRRECQDGASSWGSSPLNCQSSTNISAYVIVYYVYR